MKTWNVNPEYILIKNTIRYTLMEIEKLIVKKDIKSRTMEDRYILGLINGLIKVINSVLENISYFLKAPDIEGVLGLLFDELSIINVKSMEKNVIKVSVGMVIEVYSNEFGDWFYGRVETDEENRYYFHCCEIGFPILREGMRVRIRK